MKWSGYKRCKIPRKLYSYFPTHWQMMISRLLLRLRVVSTATAAAVVVDQPICWPEVDPPAHLQAVADRMDRDMLIDTFIGGDRKITFAIILYWHSKDTHSLDYMDGEWKYIMNHESTVTTDVINFLFIAFIYFFLSIRNWGACGWVVMTPNSSVLNVKGHSRPMWVLCRCWADDGNDVDNVDGDEDEADGACLFCVCDPLPQSKIFETGIAY